MEGLSYDKNGTEKQHRATQLKAPFCMAVCFQHMSTQSCANGMAGKWTHQREAGIVITRDTNAKQRTKHFDGQPPRATSACLRSQQCSNTRRSTETNCATAVLTDQGKPIGSQYLRGNIPFPCAIMAQVHRTDCNTAALCSDKPVF